MNARFWRGRRVFVSGHTGFKGSWLALWLSHLGAEVAGFALAPETNPNLFELLGLEANVDSRIGDVRDRANLSAALRQTQPEVVFHLASQPLVRESLERPVETFATNVMGTVHLLDAVRSTSSVRATVVITSDKCYENTGDVRAYREDEPMGGSDPYSSSKGCAELVTASYRRSFFPEGGSSFVASARAGNVIGGGDWSADRLVPDLVAAAAAGRTPILRRPAAVRPWQHVLDALSGYLMLAEALVHDGPRYAEAWNFGPSDTETLTVAELTALFLRAWGAPEAWENASTQSYHEQPILRVDSAKARARLRWQSRLDAAAGALLTAEWYHGWRTGADVRRLSLDQIAEYLALAPATDSSGR